MSKTFDDKYNIEKDLLTGQNEEKSLQSIHDRIDEIVEHSESKNKASSKTNLVAKLLGVLLLLFLAFCFYYFSAPKKSSPQLLAQESFTSFPNYQSFQTRGEHATAKLFEAYQAYDNGRFKEAVTIFESQRSNLSNEDQLYYAIALQGEDRWDESLFVLQSISGSIKSDFKPAVLWHTSLSLLANGNEDEAISILQKLKQGNSSFNEKSVVLIKQLN